MKHPHVAFFSFPHASDVNPTLSLVATLVRRGYRVTYVTSTRFASRVAAIGAEFVLCPPFPSGHSGSHTILSGTLTQELIDLAVQTISDVKTFYERNVPDLIIYDFICLAGRILADRWKIPAVQTRPAFGFDRRHLREQVKAPEYYQAILDEGRKVDSFFRRHQIDGDFPFHKEALNIYFYPRVFQLPGASFDDSCFYAARCAGEQPYERKWKPQYSTELPTVLVSTSTYYIQGPDYFNMCINALEGLQRHVVLAIGDNNDPTSFAPLPPHFEIIHRMPQIQVLPYADLLICLGGMTTTMEAMYYGVPLLMMTHGFPEPELYAENVARLGLGRHLTKTESTVENIRKLVLGISDDAALFERVQHMQHMVQSAPGGEGTANRIGEYLDSITNSSLNVRI
jgi:MGT family glycosyltransferase